GRRRAETRRRLPLTPGAMPDAPAPPPEAETPPLRRTLGRILRLARPYRLPLGAALVLLLAWSGVGLVVPLGLKALLAAASAAGDAALLARLALALLGLSALQAMLGVAGGYLLAWTGERVVADLRQRLYAHLHRLGLRFFADTRTGEITSR